MSDALKRYDEPSEGLSVATDYHSLDHVKLARFLERRRANPSSLELSLADNLIEVLRRADGFVPSAAGSILLDNVELGEWCFVGAGALLTPNTKYPPRSFILGAPGKRIREVSAKEMDWIVHSWKTYQDLARRYRA